MEQASASLALASAEDGFSVLMTRARMRCLGAEEGMTRQSQTEKTMPREMVAAVSQRGTPTLACRQATQSDHFLQIKSVKTFNADGFNYAFKVLNKQVAKLGCLQQNLIVTRSRSHILQTYSTRPIFTYMKCTQPIIRAMAAIAVTTAIWLSFPRHHYPWASPKHDGQSAIWRDCRRMVCKVHGWDHCAL